MKRILVAVDLGPGSSAVVEESVHLARGLGGKVRLGHVVAMPSRAPQPGVFAAPVTLGVQDVVRCAEQELRGLEATIPAELRDGISIEVGHACEHVCDLSRRYDADLVVIGAHRYGRVARALGTTAARIVNLIDRPIYVVRPLPPDHLACESSPT